MAYEADKDKRWGKRVASTGEHSRLEVEYACYDGGTTKLQVSRIGSDRAGNEQWKKLGRLTPEEALALSGALMEMAQGQIAEQATEPPE